MEIYSIMPLQSMINFLLTKIFKSGSKKTAKFRCGQFCRLNADQANSSLIESYSDVQNNFENVHAIRGPSAS